MEGEDGVGARLGVEPVGEAGLSAGGLVEERKRTTPGGKASREPLGVAARLDLHPRKGRALLLGLDHRGGLAVDIEQVVSDAEARCERELADGDPAGGMNVGGGDVLHCPAGSREQAVDLVARTLLRGLGLVLH